MKKEMYANTPVAQGDSALFPVQNAPSSSISFGKSENLESDLHYPQLISLLENQHWTVRGEAAEALGKLGDKRAVKPLVQTLLRGSQQDVYLYFQHQALLQIVSALGQLADSRAVKPLSILLDKGYKWALTDWQLELKRTIISSLAAIGTNQVVQALLAHLSEDEPEELRALIIEKLIAHQLYKPQANFQLLVKALRYGIAENKQLAWKRLESVAQVLGASGNYAAVPYLVQAASDEYVEVRLAVALALADLGAPEAFALLTALTRDNAFNIRQTAAQKLRTVAISQ